MAAAQTQRTNQLNHSIDAKTILRDVKREFWIILALAVSISLLSFMPLTFAIASVLRRLHNRNCIRLQRIEDELLRSLDKQQ